MNDILKFTNILNHLYLQLPDTGDKNKKINNPNIISDILLQ